MPSQLLSQPALASRSSTTMALPRPGSGSYHPLSSLSSTHIFSPPCHNILLAPSRVHCSPWLLSSISPQSGRIRNKDMLKPLRESVSSPCLPQSSRISSAQSQPLLSPQTASHCHVLQFKGKPVATASESAEPPAKKAFLRASSRSSIRRLTSTSSTDATGPVKRLSLRKPKKDTFKVRVAS